MDQSSLTNVEFDSRLLEIEELYRQTKPEIAHEKLKLLQDADFNPEGLESGLFKLLQASDLLFMQNYRESLKLALEANAILDSSAFHSRVGRINIVLYRNYTSLGMLKEAERFAYDALACFRRVDDIKGKIDALNGLSRLAYINGRYTDSVDFLNEAIDLSRGDNDRMMMLIGNLGRIKILNGDWVGAAENLKTSLKLAYNIGRKKPVISGHLSLGYLYLKQRKFSQASRELSSAAVVIEEINSPRDEVILKEYMGELALEQGDIIQARKLLEEGFHSGMKIAPESTLVSQILRRLAQAELLLENGDEALKLAQKALNLSEKLGEESEVGYSQMIIASIFAMRENFEIAFDYADKGMEAIRNTGDAYNVARNLMYLADIYMRAENNRSDNVDKCYDEAYRLFKRLNVAYYAAEVLYRHGVYCCNNGRISYGFKMLIDAEQIFEKISDKGKMRSVRLYKDELSRQAVASAVSSENEFKIFGDYFSDSEYTGLKSGQFEQILDILTNRTGASRIIIYRKENNKIISSIEFNQHQSKRFIQQFEELLGEEIALDRPTLILDSRRDPFINNLIKGESSIISSVVVVPLVQNKEIIGFIYLDRISNNGKFVPFGQKELNFTVGFADLMALKLAEYEKQLLEEDNKRLKEQLMEEASFPNIITQNKQMLEMLARVRQVIDSNISISITGETGSGKDLLAKAIHYNSIRRDKRFISVNCAALPETLLESELFGHKRGAFTGADRDKVGLFEEADGGTFFLDEIADMPLSIQAKVLRILEEKEIVRLGETKPIKVDVRIVSATNKDLKVEMESGQFRQDLYYRLTALCFKIPPLRERKEDIPLLIKHFAGDQARFLPEAIKYLVSFDWPGNVRELENEIKKLTLLAGEDGEIGKALMSSKILDNVEPEDSEEIDLNTDINFSDNFSLYDYLAEYERRFIIKALREKSGVKKHAARSLNIPESTLRLKIKQYNIDLNDLSAA